MTERRCRCLLPLVPPDELPHWWPQRDPEPGEQVLAVAPYQQDPGLLRLIRLRDGWHHRGSGINPLADTPPVRWADTGRCWAGAHHAVVDATELVASAEQRPHLVALTDTITPPPVIVSPPSLEGADGADAG